MNTQRIRQILPCYSLRYYGAPADKLTFERKCWISYKKQKEERKNTKEFFELYATPDNLSEKELIDFLYLRACLYLKKKPMGDFEGNAKICAEVLQSGGNIVDMYNAGADPFYSACLSHYDLDPAIQQKIIDAHIPF
jgi:hypothetical protein